MVEGKDLEEVKSYANLIAEKVKEAA
jgi:hypothetical protein